LKIYDFKNFFSGIGGRKNKMKAKQAEEKLKKLKEKIKIKKEKENKKAGSLIRKYYDKNFENFEIENFKEEIKKIFG
jgi:hypothetical protein